MSVTSWRFENPVSYWDPKHYGFLFVWIELALAVGASIYVGCRGGHLPMRIIAFMTLAFYLAGITFVVVMWMPNSCHSLGDVGWDKEIPARRDWWAGGRRGDLVSPYMNNPS